MAYSITSVNSTIILSVTGLLPPTQLQGYAVDDIFTSTSITHVETMQGLDGILSGGFVPVPKPVRFRLMANSQSISFFEAWFQSEEQIADVYQCNGIITQPGIGRTYTLAQGFLTDYHPIADAARVLQPRDFTVLFQNIIAAAI
jgi:hypothetical protein